MVCIRPVKVFDNGNGTVLFSIGLTILKQMSMGKKSSRFSLCLAIVRSLLSRKYSYNQIQFSNAYLPFSDLSKIFSL